MLGDLVQRYLDHLRDRGYSEHTRRGYAQDLATLETFLRQQGCTSPDQVDLRTLRAWLAAQTGASRATVQRRACGVRAFYAWAVRARLVPSDAAAGLRSPKTPKRLPATITQAEAAEMLRSAIAVAAEDDSAVGARDVAILELLYAAGIRVSELCGLDLGDLDLARQAIRVLGKGNKERLVPISRTALLAGPPPGTGPAQIRTGRLHRATSRCPNRPAGGAPDRAPGPGVGRRCP